MERPYFALTLITGILGGLVLCYWILPRRNESAVAAEPKIEGLWDGTSVRNLTQGEYRPRRREFHLFGQTHQMVILAGEDRPKLSKSLSGRSSEEFLSQQPIGAGLYRYERDGEKIVRSNVAALSAYYEGRTFIGDLEFAADTLVLRDSHSANGHKREWTMRRVE